MIDGQSQILKLSNIQKYFRKFKINDSFQLFVSNKFSFEIELAKQLQLIMIYNTELISNKNTEKSYQTKATLLDKYFVSNHNQFDKSFVHSIFELAQQDLQIQNLIRSLSNNILYSKQKSAIYFLHNLFERAEYQQIASDFLVDVIYFKSQIYNQPLLLYVLKQLPQFLKVITTKNNQTFIESIITFLAYKMRSFDLQVRLTSLQTLKELGKTLISQKGDWQKAMKRVVPMMVQKQQLVKQVSYTKGLFLQMLQDQFHDVRISTIQCLDIYRAFIRPQDLKQIIIYMLNDEHELVREEALKTAKNIKDLPLVKQDVQTLLMCLKEKRTNLRRLVYESLSLIRINDTSLILRILAKVLTALQFYRSDKKHIYMALFELGSKYWFQIGKFFDKLGLNQIQQPNCKNIVYKAKMVLCHTWWKNRGTIYDQTRIPEYFTRHMLYIRDVEAYLIKSSSVIQEETESSVEFCELKGNFHHFIRFIQCEEDISQQFHATLLRVARQFAIGHVKQEKLELMIKDLIINYNLGTEEKELIQQFKRILQINNKNIDAILQLVKKCIKNRQSYEEKNQLVPFNKCTISRLEPNLVLTSKCKQFIDNAYLKCLKGEKYSVIRTAEYKKVSQLQFLSENQENYFWRANLSKYVQIYCILLSSNRQEKITDTYQPEQR